MVIANYIFMTCSFLYLLSLTVMYMYLARIDRKTSLYPPSICSNYSILTKEETGRIGLLYYVNRISGITAIISIAVQFFYKS